MTRTFESKTKGLDTGLPSEERRRIRRLLYSRNEIPKVDLICEGLPRLRGSIVNLSSIGAAVQLEVIPENLHDDIRSCQRACKVLVKIGKGRLEVSGYIRRVSTVRSKGKDVYQLGIEFEWGAGSELAQTKADDQVLLDPKFQPQVSSVDLFNHNEILLFKLVGVVKDRLILSTSKSNKLLIPGQRLKVRISVLDLEGYLIPVVIKELEVFETRDTNYRIYVAFANEKRLIVEKISNYVLSFSNDATPKNLKDMGWMPVAIAKGLKFEYVVYGSSSWKEVLDLRLNAAKSAGRWLDINDPTVMEDRFDPIAKHFAIKLSGRIVGAARVVENEGDLSRSEHAGWGVDLPPWLQAKGFTECSRVCTDPNYRGSDVFLSILQHLGRMSMRSGEQYLLVNCVDSLVPIYMRFGAKPLGLRFTTPFMQGNMLNVLVIDVPQVTVGFGLNPVYYNIAFKTVSDKLIKLGFMRTTVLGIALRKLVVLFNPIARLVLRSKQRGQSEKKE